VKHRLVVAVDLDATIAYYTHWRGPKRIGRPLSPSVRHTLVYLRARDARIVLFTTRARHGKKPIRDWLRRHELLHLVDEITDRKVFWHVLFDDRARHVPANEPHGFRDAVLRWGNELP